MNTRLFFVYAAIVLVLEGLAALAAYKLLPMAGYSFTLEGYPLCIAAAVVAGFLARLADFTVENIELNSHNIDLGRI